MTCPGREAGIRTVSGCQKSCCSRPRWRRSDVISPALCTDFRTCPAWPQPTLTTCWRSGVAWATTAGRGTCTAAPSLFRKRSVVNSPGRSTAAAIASICFGERAAILDGNVRRVLARYLGFDADLSSSALVDELWQRAHDLLPVENLQEDMPRYTQALMDLGATVCRRSKPACERCPLGSDCVARRDGRQSELPVKSRKLRRRSEQWWLLWVERPDGAIWLERRPDKGIWAGLYCLPVMRSQEELEALVSTQDILDTLVGHLGLVREAGFFGWIR